MFGPKGYRLQPDDRISEGDFYCRRYSRKMAKVAWLAELEGREMKGTSRLHLEWLPEDQRITPCESTLSLRSAVGGNHQLLQYEWNYDNEWQHGLMMIGYKPESGKIRIAWADNWHNGTGFMDCTGELTPEGVIRVNGHYPAHEGPDWGWRIELSAEAGGLRFAMTNISPEGQESWATDCLYQ